MDLIMDLPKSNGFNAVLTIIDHGCSKVAKFILCTTNITRKGVAALYLQHLVPWFGIPRKIISNHNPQFISHFTKELCCLLHIQQNISTAFHPHTNSASEQANQWLKQYLRSWTTDDQVTWAQYLSLVEFVHNSWPHDRTTLTPHELLFGVKPPFPLSNEEAWVPDVTTRL
jgi:transposase InsO family protein